MHNGNNDLGLGPFCVDQELSVLTVLVSCRDRFADETEAAVRVSVLKRRFLTVFASALDAATSTPVRHGYWSWAVHPARKGDMRYQDESKQCEAEITRLEAENRDLRRASESFADLAERLNQQLQSERGLKTAERDHAQRNTSDERSGLVDWARVEVA
jgi:hypothetical protein